MSTRVAVVLDDDVLDRVKRESRSRSASFRDTLNDLLRVGLLSLEDRHQRRSIEIKPVHMGYRPGMNYDDIESLVEYGEDQQHR